MKLLERVHALRAGAYKDGNGRYDFYSAADLRQIADAYNPDVHSAPMRVEDLAIAVLGHNDPRTKSAMPAFGWILRAYAEGNNLFLDVVVHDMLAEWICDRFYEKISMSFYSATDPHNPTPGIRSIRHIGFLGAEPPVVKGLDALPMPKPFNFAAGLNMTYDALKPTEFAEGTSDVAAEMPNWLRYVLADGDKGYKGEITRFDPEPSSENGFLMNEDATEFSGKFIDESDEDAPETYTFRIYKQGESWTREYAMKKEGEDNAGAAEIEAKSGTGEASVEAEEVPTELMEAKDEDYEELSEEAMETPAETEAEGGAEEDYKRMYEDMKAERDALQAAMDAMTAEQKAAEYAEYCECAGIPEEKRPATIKLMFLLDKCATSDFSESSGMSPLDFFKTLASSDSAADVDTGAIEFAETLGSDTSVHGKALAYCTANGLDSKKNADYLTAVKAVSQ